MKGIEIKLLRIQKGLKQSFVSKETGIPSTYLSLIENDNMKSKKYTDDFINGLKSKIVNYLQNK